MGKIFIYHYKLFIEKRGLERDSYSPKCYYKGKFERKL